MTHFSAKTKVQAYFEVRGKKILFHKNAVGNFQRSMNNRYSIRNFGLGFGLICQCDFVCSSN